jgi:hypothetical protein
MEVEPSSGIQLYLVLLLRRYFYCRYQGLPAESRTILHKFNTEVPGPTGTLPSEYRHGRDGGPPCSMDAWEGISHHELDVRTSCVGPDPNDCGLEIGDTKK